MLHKFFIFIAQYAKAGTSSSVHPKKVRCGGALYMTSHLGSEVHWAVPVGPVTSGVSLVWRYYGQLQSKLWYCRRGLS
jgi:hypothetical protein